MNCIYIGFRLLLFLFIFIWLLAACGESSPTSSPSTTTSRSTQSTQFPGSTLNTVPTPLVGTDGQITVVAPPSNASAFKGTIFFVRNNNIFQGGVNLPGIPPVSNTKLGGQSLTNTPGLALAKTPALSPDGLTLAYAYSPEPEVGAGGRIVIGQDILGYDLKSKTTKTLMQRQEPDMFLEDPVWSVDGKYLYASYRSPVRDKSGAVVGQKVGIQRLEVTTGKRELLLEDGREPAPSADGKSLVFIGVAASTMTFDYSFKIMDLQTRQIRELTNPSQNFIAFYFPRLSPDGKWIVFSAIGGPDSITSQPNPLPSGTTGAGGGVRAALLHGLPYDLWLIRPDGSGLRRLTVLFEDQPMPVWSKDSQRVIFLAGQGFYSVEITTGSLLKISDEGSHGGFDYRE